MADVRRLIEAAIAPDLAKEIGAQIDAATGNRRRLVELGMVPAIATEVAMQITVGGNTRRLIELGMAPDGAMQLVSAIASAVVVSFTTQPVVNPSSGTAGQTFTATPGTVSNGSITSREWRLAGNVVSTALTYVSTAAGALTYQEFAGSVASNLIAATVTSAALPNMANLKIDFDPATLTPQADGSALSATLTDSVSGIQAVQPTSGNRPTYKVNAVGTKPGIVGNGSQWLNINSPGLFKTIIDTKTFTWMDIVINTQANGLGCIGGGTNGGQGFFPLCDGSLVGNFSNNNDRTQVQYPASAFSIIGGTSTTVDKGGSAGAGLTRTYVNGMCVGSLEGNPDTASNGATNFALLARDGAGNFPAKTTFVRRFVFDVELTPAAMLQWALAKFAEYGVAHPLAAADRVVVFDGDSLTAGVSAPSSKSISYLVAQANGYPMGTWCNVGIGGLTTQLCIDKAASEVDGVIAASGKRGVVFFQERANDMTAGLLTPAQGGAKHTTYIAGRKAANSTVKVIGQTPSDWANAYSATSPDAWNTYLLANSVSIGYTALARVDQNATIGSNGGAWNTYPESGPWSSPFSDGVHFVTYSIQAGLAAPLIAAA